MKVAIVGATGAVGREMLNDLEASSIPDIELGLYASPRSAGTVLKFRDKNVEVKPFSHAALKGTPWVLMSAGGGFSKDNSPGLVEQGSTVIDNSSAFRMTEGVPLVVPEVNPEALAHKGPKIIANPNCSTIQMVVALKPLKDAFGLSMVHVCTYQSVSGTGQKGIAELGEQLQGHFRFEELAPKVYAQPIAFNLLPGIDVFDAEGHCGEELKMVRETRKIMNLPRLEVLASTVRVPTFNCHGEMVHVQLAEEITREQALEAFAGGENIVLNREDAHAAQPTPRRATGDGRVFVSRVRLAYGAAHGRSRWLQFWNVADNLKKGAATNAVQILSKLLS